MMPSRAGVCTDLSGTFLIHSEVEAFDAHDACRLQCSLYGDLLSDQVVQPPSLPGLPNVDANLLAA